MAVAHHLLPEMQLGEGALYACLLVLAFLVGSRAYGGVRHFRGRGERLLIVGTSPLTRRVVEAIARHPRRYKLVGMVEDGIGAMFEFKTIVGELLQQRLTAGELAGQFAGPRFRYVA